MLMYAPRKSVGVAILLAFFFGPLGMFYSTVEGAFIMCVATFFSFFTGIGHFFLAWPICIVWAAMAADAHNRRLAGWAYARTGYPAW